MGRIYKAESNSGKRVPPAVHKVQASGSDPIVVRIGKIHNRLADFQPRDAQKEL